ncbi:MAG: ferritin-like domain-containing protein [Candidatus Dormibacteria bacterium]
MSTRSYALPVEQTRWEVASGNTTVFSWEYDEGRDKLLTLYEKGKNRQWNSRERIDWTTPVDHANPIGGDDSTIPIYGSRSWERLGAADRDTLRHHLASWQFSQFLHGEQGALICAAKIVQTVPDLDSKYYAATQVVDEARHVETYSRYLDEKLGLAYPVSPHLKALLNDVIADQRWDMTYLGMQVLIEGLALAAFGLIRDIAVNPLARAVNAYVMEDESRHVAFGRLALRDFYPQLTEAERAEREEFCVEACYLMRDRFLAEEVWHALDFDVADCLEHVRQSEAQQLFRSLLFTRIVPTLRDIGLFGPRVQAAFADMGVMGYSAVDLDALGASDEAAAAEIDAGRRQQVAATIAAGRDGQKAAS